MSSDFRRARGLDGLRALAVACVVVYLPGMCGPSTAAAALTLAACAPGRVGRALGCGPLVWLGRRSYGIYLWHWPVHACFAAGSPAGRITELALPVGLAAASYRLVEEPLLRLGWRGWAEAVSARARALAVRHPRVALGIALACAAVLGTAYIGVSRAPSGGGGLTEQIAAGQRAVAVRHDAERPVAGGSGITAVGDSVMLASAGELERRFSGIDVNAVVGRQMSSAPNVLAGLEASGRLRRAVVVGLGTNGGVTGDTLERILRIAGPGRTVIFVNVHVPRSWASHVNATLAAGVRRHGGAALADWDAAISRFPERLWDDGTHPRPSGARLYAKVIAGALRGPVS